MRYIINLTFVLTLVVMTNCSVDMNLGKVSIMPNTFNFGKVLIWNETGVKDFVLKNNSLKKLLISEIKLIDNSEENFEIISGGKQNSVSACTTHLMQIKFTPKSIGIKNCKLQIKFRNKKQKLDIPISGSGVNADLIIKPASNPYNFNKVLLYSNNVKTFTIENNSSSPIKLLSIKTSQAEHFSVYSTNCPITINGKSTVMFVVSFHPRKTGPLVDFLIVEHSALFSPFRIKLLGEGTLPKIVDYLPLENFDGNRFPAFWKFSGQNYCWQWGQITNLDNFQAFSNPNCMGTNLAGDYGNSQDNRLETPIIDLRKANYPILSFWNLIKTAYAQFGDGGLLEICTSDEFNYEVDVNWSEWKSLESTYPAYSIENFNGNGKPAFGGNKFELEWNEIRADLAPYVGKFVKIGWHFISDNTETDLGWYIDNVHVFEIVKD